MHKTKLSFDRLILAVISASSIFIVTGNLHAQKSVRLTALLEYIDFPDDCSVLTFLYLPIDQAIAIAS